MLGATASYDYGTIATIVVKDPNAAGSVTVSISSTLTDSDPNANPITLTLFEDPSEPGWIVDRQDRPQGGV